MKIDRLDHTGIAVRDLDAALARYHRVLGLDPSLRVVVPDQQVEVAFLPAGETQIELIAPTAVDTGVSRFLEKRGDGLHHLAVAVRDIEAELSRLAQDGVELIDHVPRHGVHGRVAFIRPAALGGVLLELVEGDG